MRKNWKYETCSICTREQRFVWAVSEALWNQVVIDHYCKEVICLECFLRMADDRGIKIKITDIITTEVI